jgi:ankyrin repeat protein
MAGGTEGQDVVFALLKAGADVTKVCDGYPGETVLTYPIWNAHHYNVDQLVPNIALLVERGANINRADRAGFTPLYAAMVTPELDSSNYRNGPYYREKLVEAILAAGAEVKLDIEDSFQVAMNRPAVCAAANCSLNILGQLEAAGANLHADDFEGSTLMHHAASNATYDLISALAKAGWDINAKSEFHGVPIDVAALNNGNSQVMKAIIDAGALIKQLSVEHAARSNPNPEVLTLLLENYQGPKGLPLLTLLAQRAATSNPEPLILKAILDQGLPPTWQHPTSGQTLLHIAANSNSNPMVLEMLIKAGADLDAEDGNGQTAAEVAVMNKNLAGADIMTKLKPSKLLTKMSAREIRSLWKTNERRAKKQLTDAGPMMILGPFVGFSEIQVVIKDQSLRNFGQDRIVKVKFIEIGSSFSGSDSNILILEEGIPEATLLGFDKGEPITLRVNYITLRGSIINTNNSPPFFDFEK